MKPLSALAVTFTLCAAASAQPYTVTFDLVYDKPVLQPGESQLISIYATTGFKAGTEYTIQNCPLTWLNGTKGVMKGLSNALFDVVNVANGQNGNFSDFGVPYPWNFLGNNIKPGTPDSNGGLENIQASQPEFLQIPDPPFIVLYELHEPALVWQGTWTPKPGFAGDVTFSVETSAIGLGISPSVFVESPQLQFWTADRWMGIYNQSSFTVIPSPGFALAGTLAYVIGAACSRRRQSQHPIA